MIRISSSDKGYFLFPFMYCFLVGFVVMLFGIQLQVVGSDRNILPFHVDYQPLEELIERLVEQNRTFKNSNRA